MVLEVVEAAIFKFDEIGTQDTFLELFFVAVLVALVTAAGNERVEDKDREARDHENGMLEYVQNQVKVELGAWLVSDELT